MDIIYDLETYPNVFLCAAYSPATDTHYCFEISPWRDDSSRLNEWLNSLVKCRMVGFNNLSFDYPIIHHFMDMYPMMDGLPLEIAASLYKKCTAIIHSQDKFQHVIWDRDQYVQQVDLFKIHHFDNTARSTSLKLLEFNMRLPNVQELPFPPGTVLTAEQAVTLKEYSRNDIEATTRFYFETQEMIKFREELGPKYLNFNDTKIGKQFFTDALERHQKGLTRNEFGMRQTIHDTLIPLNTVIFPYIQFTHPEFQRVHAYLLQEALLPPQKDLSGVSATVNGFRFDFGSGGIHGSVNNRVFEADLEHALIDIDVKSYYPNLAIVNRLYPAHLGEVFCDIYQDLYHQRTQHPKGSTMNKALKLALNGVYGDTGNPFSHFFDMKYLLSITINGQLLLCMLAEQLMVYPQVEVIQINTDGITLRVPRDMIPTVHSVCDWWQKYTLLELEEVEYFRMWIKDVNNYLAEGMDGAIKRKGAYENLPPGERNPTGWHQNLSALVVPKAVEAYLRHGVDIRSFIYHHADIMDFMLRTKIPRASKLVMGDQTLQRITRYLVTVTGGTLTKVSPSPDGCKVGQWKRANSVPDWLYRKVIEELKEADVYWGRTDLDSTGLPWDERINTKNRSTYTERRTGVEVGWLVTVYNQMTEVDRSTINFDYYIQEAQKLVENLI